MEQEKLLKTVSDFLSSKYDIVYSTDKYCLAIGDIPIGLVAHLDTVFNSPPTNIYYDQKAEIIWSPEGLGADDRAGVYSILFLIKKGYRPTVIFTTDEELGCIGADSLVADWKEPPVELKYLIELDRRGEKDCVFYQCTNKEFKEYVKSFDFTLANGSFSDISVLCPCWKIAGVNLSIGYYNEHSYTEFLNIRHMFNTIKKVEAMLKAEKTAEYYKYSEEDLQKFVTNFFNIGLVKCDRCDFVGEYFDLIPIKNHGKTEMLCLDCITKEVEISYCEKCEEFFIGLDENFCEDCKNN